MIPLVVATNITSIFRRRCHKLCNDSHQNMPPRECAYTLSIKKDMGDPVVWNQRLVHVNPALRTMSRRLFLRLAIKKGNKNPELVTTRPQNGILHIHMSDIRFQTLDVVKK